MLFNSPVFLFAFLPICLVVFAVLGRWRVRAALAWLTAASFFFYGWWDPVYLALIGFSIGFNFVVGTRLAAAIGPEQYGYRRGLFVFGIVVDLGLLFYFKYFNFLLDSLNAALGTTFAHDTIILPLAISFFTFNQITYLSDSFNGKTSGFRLIDYALFVTFFPHLIAGPIVRSRDLMPQFQRRSTFLLRDSNLAIGGSIFVIGLFKKVVFADGVAVYATPAFSAALSGATLTFVEAWGAALAFTLQLYFDFSGYSDMAIGLARMFGVHFPLNFHSPYKAVNIIEFWRRWHMTLSQFLRDYLYIPLGGNRRGTLRRYVNLMLTMLLGGLWHGAGWTFVIWGGLHGVYLVANHLWQHLTHGFRPRHAAARRVTQWSARMLTFVAVIVAWVFFRAGSLDAALRMTGAMFGANGFVLPVGYRSSLGPLGALLGRLGWRFEGSAGHFRGGDEIAWLLGLMLVVWFLPNTQELLRAYRPALDFAAIAEPRPQRGMRWRPDVRSAIAVAVLATLSLLSLNRVTEFLYFQF